MYVCMYGQCHIHVGPGVKLWVAVEKSSLSQAVQKLLPVPFQRPLRFPVEDVGFVFGDGTIEKPVPENGSVDTGFVSLPSQWFKLDRGAAYLNPHAVKPQNQSRGFRRHLRAMSDVWLNSRI